MILRALLWIASISSICVLDSKSFQTGAAYSNTGLITPVYKNSSGDEIANVNFFYNIAHVEASAYAH